MSWMKEKISGLYEKAAPALIVIRSLFVYSLLFYLLLFLLENVLPGFVSHNFNLNWVLGVVFVLGVIALLAPQEEKTETEEKDEDKPKTIDYILAVLMGLISAWLIYTKIDIEGIYRIVTAIVSGVLVIFIGILTLLGADEEGVDESYAEGRTEEGLMGQTRVVPEEKGLWVKARKAVQSVMLKRAQVPLVFTLFLILATAVFIPQNIKLVADSLGREKTVEIENEAVEINPEEQINQQYWDDLPWLAQEVSPSSDTLVRVLNGGATAGAAGEFAQTLHDIGFVNVEAGNADNYDYENATIYFKPEDKEQAALIKNVLSNTYEIIFDAPLATTSAQIQVVLGKNEKEEELFEEFPEDEFSEEFEF